MATPGTIETLRFQWAHDEQWKRDLLTKGTGDMRQPRDTTPRYQTEDDRKLAEGTKAAGAENRSTALTERRDA